MKIIELLTENKNITIPAIAEKLKLTTRAIEKQNSKLQTDGVIRRIGPDNGGQWEVVRGSLLGR